MHIAVSPNEPNVNIFRIGVWTVGIQDTRPLTDLLWHCQLLACHRLDRGRYVPLTLDEARTGWTTLRAKYPEVFTVPIDECLAWHLKEDAESVRKKHRHAALFAANFDCRDRPNEPHPFVARGRLFTVLGDYNKAAANFAMAWKLGGTGWVKSECRRMVRDAWRKLQEGPSKNPSPPTPLIGREEDTATLAKLQIAATYLEQDPRTMCVALLGKPPLHRIAIAVVKQRLGVEWDERDRQALRGCCVE